MHAHLASQESRDRDKEKENAKPVDNLTKDKEANKEEKEEGKGSKTQAAEDEKTKEGGKEGKTSKEGKDSEKSRKLKPLDNWIFCRLGHLHLLLEQFPKGIVNQGSR